MEREYKFPVWGTQGGGLAREVKGTFIFVTKPDCPGLDVGDEVPKEWDLAPANALARQQATEEEFPFPSIPWDQERDGVAAYEKMPTRLDHWPGKPQ